MTGGEMLGGGGGGFKVPAFQDVAVLSQANPVSGTKYAVLAATKNARVVGISAAVTWTVQPSPLEAHVTLDGVVVTFSTGNPVSTTTYNAIWNPNNALTGQPLTTTADGYNVRNYLLEGRSVLIELETTGGTTQSLNGRVVYAKW